MLLRQLEAKLGYDPDECPPELLSFALTLNSRLGDDALAELAPVYACREAASKPATAANLAAVDALCNQQGLVGSPQFSASAINFNQHQPAPWKRGVEAAPKLPAAT